MIVHYLTRLYTTLLRLYPRGFYVEFSEEMREAFSQAAEEAAAQGNLPLARLFLQELISLPASIVHAGQQAQGARPVSSSLALQHSPFEQSGRELLLALAVFLLPAVMILVGGAPQTSASFGMPATLLFLIVMIVIGWLGGFPLWSLPYVGLVLAIAGYLVLFQWVASLVSPALISSFTPGVWDRSTYLLLEVVSNGMVWLMLFCLTLMVVALLAVFNRFQPLLARVRQDWTLLSYILYGESFFALFLLFENHRYEPNYAIAGLFCLLAGVWFYLHSSAQWKRLLALLGCLTLAVGIAVLANRQLAPGLDWAASGTLRVSNVGRLLLSWIWMVLALLLPGLLSRLPALPASTPSE
jgi:hypothetical protein